jgi:peptide/nickel transport system substrate-binding protein
MSESPTTPARPWLTRRTLLGGLLAAAGVTALAGCVAAPPPTATPGAKPAEPTKPAAAAPTTAPAAAPTSAPAAAATTAPAPAPTTAAAAKPAGPVPDELVLAWGTNQLLTKGLDPQTHVGTIAESQLRHMYEPLVAMDRDLKTVKPLLATEWKRLDDLTVQFKLRQGVKYHNGEDFDAEAVKFSIMRPLDPANNADARTSYSIISGVDVIDKYTVNIKTSKPDPVLMTRLSGFSMTQVAPKWAAANGIKGFGDGKESVGTGPYKLTQWTRGQDLVMEANPTYWGGAPPIKKVRIKTIPELGTRSAAVRSGEVHIAKDMPLEEVTAFNNSGKVMAKITQSNRVPFYFFEVRKPPLDNVKVRQAINYASNVDGIIKALLLGNGTRVPTMVAPWHVGFPSKLTPYAYDAAKAKALLTEAGFPNGIDLTINHLQGRYMKDKEVAEALAQELNKAGIRAKTNMLEAGVMTERVLARQLEGLVFASWGNWMFDADNALVPLFHSTTRDTINQGKGQSDRPYGNPELDKLLDAARIELDAAKRQELYEQAGKIMYDDAAALFMYTLSDIYGVSNLVDWEPRKDEMVWAYEMKWK